MEEAAQLVTAHILQSLGPWCLVQPPSGARTVGQRERPRTGHGASFVHTPRHRTSTGKALGKRVYCEATLEFRRKIQRLKFLYLLKNNKLSMRPEQYIQPLTARRTRHRHADSLTPFNARTNIFKFSFFPRTVTEWNQLPASFVNSIDSIDHIVS